MEEEEYVQKVCAKTITGSRKMLVLEKRSL